MSNSEYRDHISLPGTMMSKSLASALAQADVEKSELPTNMHDILLVTSAEQNVSFRNVVMFSVSEDVVEVGVVAGREKMRKSQSLYQARCSLSFGTFQFENLSLAGWQYTVEGEKIVVTMVFNRKLSVVL